MKALHIVTTLTSSQLEIPKEWVGKEVEITLKEINSSLSATNSWESRRLAIRKLLLNGPTLTKKELQPFRNSVEHFQNWQDIWKPHV